MPKCEIFDRLDFHNFYTIKSLWGGNTGVKTKLKKIYLRVQGREIPNMFCAHSNFKEDFWEFRQKSNFFRGALKTIFSQ